MTVPKHERLLNLILYLMERRRPTSADDIHREIAGYPDNPAAFRRAFERDKSELRTMGVPILTEVIDPDDPNSHGYRIDPDEYGLPDPGLTPTEVAALAVAIQTVALDGVSADAHDALRRFGGVEGGSRGDGGGLPPIRVLTPDAAGDVVTALSEERTVAFSYDGVDRVVEPWRLDHRRGRWYLNGFDRTRGASRLFRLDRIDGSVTLGDVGSFVRSGPHPPPEIDAWRLGGGGTSTAVIAVDPGYADIAARQFNAVRPSDEDAAGRVLLPVDYRNEAGLFDTLLGLLDHAVVVQPADLRDRFVAWLTAIATGGGVPR